MTIMSDALTTEDLTLLDELAAADWLEPVAPPAAAKTQLLELVRSLAASRTVRAGEGRWCSQIPGIDVKLLSRDETRGIATILMRFQPGAVCPPHDHSGAEECYVVSGSCRIGTVSLSQGDFHHADAGSHHGAVVSDEGCTLLLVIDQDDYIAA
jgi:quercetin dioxygenase-like cupin family protein